MTSSERSHDPSVNLDDELRSCLAAIVGYAVLLDSDDPGVRRDAPRRIVERVQHLSETLGKLRLEFREPEETAADTEAAEPPRRIVIVDDDPVSSGILKRMVPTHFELLEAGDQAGALQLAGLDNVELVILSWRASAFSGPETLAEIKIRFPDIPVIVIGEAEDDVYEGVAVSLGADKFLTRPLDSLKLLAAADELHLTDDGRPPAGTANAVPSL